MSKACSLCQQRSEIDMGKLNLGSELREGEWLLKAYYPATMNQRQEWTIYVYQSDKLIRQVKLPMQNSTRFGPDPGDAAELQRTLAEMLKEFVAKNQPGE